jgi:transcriptional regulator with XRE-family HTH domain
MPRKPQFLHPLRVIRTCLGHTQPSFARLLGCSPITIQRIENGSLAISRKMAYTIMEATGADPVHLRTEPRGEAIDMMGQPYSKQSYDACNKILPLTDSEILFLVKKIVSYAELMLIASQPGAKYRTRAVFAEIVESFQKAADDFDLKTKIHDFLIEKGSVDKRIYRVSDLRKFPKFADIIGFKDEKRFSPDKLIPHSRPKGWIRDYFLIEEPVLPPDIAMKLPSKKLYLMDDERELPEELKKMVDQALYWEITEFRLSLTEPPQGP